MNGCIKDVEWLLEDDLLKMVRALTWRSQVIWGFNTVQIISEVVIISPSIDKRFSVVVEECY